MTIPGRGDLMPARRRRHNGASARRIAVPLLVVVVLAGAGYLVWHQWFRTSPTTVRTQPYCPAVTPVVAPDRASQVRVRVLNTTGRSGLAATTSHQLVRRGFVAAGVGNATPRVDGATVRYPTGAGSAGLAEARALAEVVPHAVLRPTSRKGPVLLEIGSGWHGLASPAAAAEVRASDEAAAHPSPRPGCRS